MSDSKIAAARLALRAAPSDTAPLLPLLRLAAWNALTPEARLEVAQLLAAALGARSRPLTLLGVAGFGPNREQPVARYLDARTELVFALVPGGTLRPGLSEEEFAYLKRLGEFHEAAEAPRQSEPIEIEPFLMSVAPVRAGFAGLPEFEYQDEVEIDSDSFVPTSLSPEDVPDALRAVEAALPTTLQLEWVGRGGRGLLFPWGSKSHDFGHGALALSFPSR